MINADVKTNPEIQQVILAAKRRIRKLTNNKYSVHVTVQKRTDNLTHYYMKIFDNIQRVIERFYDIDDLFVPSKERIYTNARKMFFGIIDFNYDLNNADIVERYYNTREVGFIARTLRRFTELLEVDREFYNEYLALSKELESEGIKLKVKRIKFKQIVNIN